MDQFVCNAGQFQAAFCYGTKQLAINKELINSINILPVPNGNTGTNLHKTLLSSLQEMTDDAHLGNLVQQCAGGALLGASGSSGVILANFLIGFAETIEDKVTALPNDILRAVGNGYLKAKAETSVIADGGILDIGAALYDHFSTEQPENQTLEDTVSSIHKIACNALAAIPAKNLLFSRMGINDAGAAGLFHFIDGVYRYAAKKPLERNIVPSRSLSLADDAEIKDTLYSIEFLINNVTLPVEDIKKSLSDIGDPVLLAYGKGDTVKVLIRTTDPKRVFDRSARFGRSARIKVDDLVDERRYFLSKMQNEDIL
ncbi:MAG: DAK2 domain-containing protein [Candidatus Omnitrophica bacterium]|nr:DAK2 domain-containing protein [Candidatus Omnitrophota bacterium]